MKWSCYGNIVIQFGFIGAQFLQWMDVTLDHFIAARKKTVKKAAGEVRDGKSE